jgi:uncharacterized protein
VKDSKSFSKRYGPWAIIAGGSEGLGAAFAEQLADQGLNLFLLARRPEPLAQTRDRLRAAFKVEVRTLAADLADPATIGLIQRETTGMEIGLLVCDAAITYTGEFFKQSLPEYHRMLDLNCRAFLDLVHIYGGVMAHRGHGGIVVMSSMAAFQGSPLVAVYGATKSFLLSLAEGVGDELARVGVDMLACCPAVILTPHFLSEAPSRKVPLSLAPAVVARQALRALGKKRVLVPSALGKVTRFMMGHLMPRAATVGMMGRSTRALYGGKST